MKKITLLLSLFYSLFCTSQNYTFTNFTEDYNDLIGATPISNGDIWDDPEYILTLPFSININGVTMSSLIITDGIVLQNTISPISQAMSPFSPDLIDRGDGGTTSLSPISYKIEGVVGSQILKIEFKNCGASDDSSLSMFVNFQIWIYEGSDIIEYRYGPSFITDPSVFYETETGSIIGVASVDDDENLSNSHFLIGPVANPTLSSANIFVYVIGTPQPNTVYRFTPTTLTTLSLNKPKVFVYPNPSQNSIFINGLEDSAVYEIYDSKGILVHKGLLELSNSEVKITALNSGVYFIRVLSDKSAVTKRFIKM